jgi:hypothetical protein
MFTDTGIYIAKFTDGYRVIHTQDINNCLDVPDNCFGTFSELELQAERILYFANSQNYQTKEAACEQASRLEKEIGHPTEYGICEFTWNHPLFDKIQSVEEAHKIIDKHWQGNYTEDIADGVLQMKRTL